MDWRDARDDGFMIGPARDPGDRPRGYPWLGARLRCWSRCEERAPATGSFLKGLMQVVPQMDGADLS